ncbi:sugar transferase [Acetatifactor muris]|uniref:sugar transferase n=1 Tax=Acetatifactor muris TaxID=879566 RepID=UPI0023F04959|nr:sugar transferase [Acetatifactor muris]
MKLRKWDNLPEFMKCDEVRVYYDILAKRRMALSLKRIFDVILASVMIVILAIPMMIIAFMIKSDSSGPVFYCQERVTAYGKKFKIHKFRTMVKHADKIGAAVTVEDDVRITKIGSKLRHFRLDEIPQLIDVLTGNMSFVGTRPEVAKYVERYKPEYNATLLMPAGITSEASIRYKDEDKMLRAAGDVDQVYVEYVLPAKMKWNLNSIKKFSFHRDIWTMIRTFIAVLAK